MSLVHAPLPTEFPVPGHRLRSLSYYEFRTTRGVYVQKYGIAMAADQCAAIETDPPLERGEALFDGITELDVRNLLHSLHENVPLFDGVPPLYPRGEFVFGVDDVLWMLKVGVKEERTDGNVTRAELIPEALKSASAIAAYLNALRVETCELVQSKLHGASEWHVRVALPALDGIPVEYGSGTALLARCRTTSLPQRTLDVVPLLLMTDERKTCVALNTTVSTRRCTRTVIDDAAYENVGCARPGRNMIVGAGEHLEPSDAFVQMADSMPLEGAFGATGTPIRIDKLLNEKGAIVRALREEVGLTRQVLERAQMWLVGRHQTLPTDSVSRDLRYWPREVHIDGERVLYGYRRSTTTVVFVAVMHVGPGTDERTMSPDDQTEIASVQLRPWDEVVRAFRDAAEMKPAFGWAHELMVKITNRSVPMMVHRYAEEHGIWF
jgi:8-oxo-dGTP pyrophosphatase MutT (NUDIX family)